MLSFSLDKEIRTDVSADNEPLSFSCSNMSDIEALFIAKQSGTSSCSQVFQ